MQLSVVIVNYNVKHFLEQALLSVERACRGIESEVFVVDNNSVDGSVEMLQSRFPWVKLIANKNNPGFSIANNQAIRQSSGEFVLLLNPDTVVQEDTFQKCLAFMAANKNAGGLGVKMVDGNGDFLPESKRAFPSPRVAFFKAFGMASLFPKSRFFAKYHLGHLPENQTNKVEVLAGAFMLLRKSVLEKVGLLDEQFFMYGEDVDLSYRIVKAGYDNYYFPETTIIHYKGESTKRASFNYVKLFYSAMKIFTKKHFKGSRAGLLIFFINLAIYLKAGLAMVGRWVKKLYLPILEAGLIFLGMFLIKGFWETNVKLAEGFHYPPEYLKFNVPLYILIWIGCNYFSGAYDRPLRISKLVRGLVIGTVIIAAVYGFLDEQFRFSRGMLLLGSAWSVVTLSLLRWILGAAKLDRVQLGKEKPKRIAILGDQNESERVRGVLVNLGLPFEYIGRIETEENASLANAIGGLHNLKGLLEVYHLDEIIFCSKNMSSQRIISTMSQFGKKIQFKIVPQESMSIIGSNSKNSAGDIYALDIHLSVQEARQVRNKRVLDFSLGILFLAIFPILIFLQKKPLGFFPNVLSLLWGSKTLVSYTLHPNALPELKRGILNPSIAFQSAVDKATAERLDALYAKNYDIYEDLEILRRAYRMIGGE